MTDYIYSIEAKNVNKTYKRKNLEVNALKDFNIKIKKGSIHGLLGPNGAGKSTFINILGGLVKKNKGKVICKKGKIYFKKGCVCKGIYNNSKKTKFSIKKSRKSKIVKWF